LSNHRGKNTNSLKFTHKKRRRKEEKKRPREVENVPWAWGAGRAVLWAVGIVGCGAVVVGSAVQGCAVTAVR